MFSHNNNKDGERITCNNKRPKGGAIGILILTLEKVVFSKGGKSVFDLMAMIIKAKKHTHIYSSENIIKKSNQSFYESDVA